MKKIVLFFGILFAAFVIVGCGSNSDTGSNEILGMEITSNNDALTLFIGEDNFTFQGSKPMKGYYDLTLTGGVPVLNKEKNDFENKVTGEEKCRLHETKIFQFRGYEQYLPEWYKQQNK